MQSQTTIIFIKAWRRVKHTIKSTGANKKSKQPLPRKTIKAL